MKYTTIYSDPPWPQGGGGIKGAKNYYTTMSFDRIKLLGDFIDDISAPDSHLYMWAVSNYLQEALDTMRAWGYRYVTNIAWVKDRIGLGYYYRTKHELLLFGVKGKALTPHYKSHFPSVLEAPRRKHSAKPHEFYNLIEGVSPGPYLELFARNFHPGWAAWGNELVTDDGRTGEDACDVKDQYGFWQPPLAA